MVESRDTVQIGLGQMMVTMVGQESFVFSLFPLSEATIEHRRGRFALYKLGLNQAVEDVLAYGATAIGDSLLSSSFLHQNQS